MAGAPREPGLAHAANALRSHPTTRQKTAPLCDGAPAQTRRAENGLVLHRETLARLAQLMQQEGHPYVIFAGGMSGPEKDAAVERFRVEVPLLLCTGVRCEGRNLQFCNTLVNFDLPWTPMTIEQRMDAARIGQTRDVFVFNLPCVHAREEVLSILDEKINMFEMVVGEIDAILGEMSEEQELRRAGCSRPGLETTETERTSAFTALGEQLAAAKGQYEAVQGFG